MLHRERRRSRAWRELAETRLAAERTAKPPATSKPARCARKMTGQFRLMAHETLKTQGAEMQKGHGEQLHALFEPVSRSGPPPDRIADPQQGSDEERARLKEQIEYLHKRSEGHLARGGGRWTRALKGDSQKRGAWGEMILESYRRGFGLIAGTHYDIQTSRRDADGRLAGPDVMCGCRRKSRGDRQQGVAERLKRRWQCRGRSARVSRPAPPCRRDPHPYPDSWRPKGLSGAGRGLGRLRPDVHLYRGRVFRALRVDPDLTRHATDENRVGLATPTTLMLTLRTVDHIWTVERRGRTPWSSPAAPASFTTSCAGFVSAIEDGHGAGPRAEKPRHRHGPADARIRQCHPPGRDAARTGRARAKAAWRSTMSAPPRWKRRMRRPNDAPAVAVTRQVASGWTCLRPGPYARPSSEKHFHLRRG